MIDHKVELFQHTDTVEILLPDRTTVSIMVARDGGPSINTYRPCLDELDIPVPEPSNPATGVVTNENATCQPVLN
ncbi:MAG: hypothetical protein Unbinned2514contig1000_7 [Prokaryotic dsDNA virus sp.]|nr:MAG: hypothetical protein Unbinned2514contig1000_7 [Prokaryotic dsDNA virus sp.]|tara:strand:+ start:3360 stop:3584 length:225 start_codon:yes stop_codon:yes gene_type:complete